MTKHTTYTRSECARLLLDIFKRLPLSERALLKRLHKYPFELRNDTGHSCLYRVIVNGFEIGAIKYYKGRKLAMWELIR